MLFNRITRFLVAPTITNLQLNTAISSGYTEQSSFYDYDYNLSFTFASTFAPPVPYTQWVLVLQKSTDNVTWTNTSASGNWPATSAPTSWTVSIPSADRDVGTYYRMAVYLGTYDEFVSASSSTTPLTSLNIATYQVYGATLIYAATATSQTNIPVPTGANRITAKVLSSGGDGSGATAFDGGGGGGGRYVITPAISINSNYTFDIEYTLNATGTCGVRCNTTGDRLYVNNGGNGPVNGVGLGSTTDLYKEGIFNVTYATALNGTDSTGPYSVAGFAQSSPWGSTVKSDGPFGNSGLPADDAIMAEMFGCGGNGCLSTQGNQNPALGSGGIVQITFTKV
jgi:hypothetical protein